MSPEDRPRTPVKLLVVGAGSLGGGLAAVGHIAGGRVTLLARASSIERVRGGYLYREAEGRKPLVVNPSVVGPLDPPDASPPDLAIIAVKAFDTADAVRSMARHMGKDTIVLTLQNGVGAARTIRETLSLQGMSNQVVRGVTSHGFHWKDGILVHAGAGETLLGPERDPPVSECIDWLGSMGVEAVGVPDILEAEWSKAVVNACINPLTAIVGCENGILGTDPDLVLLWTAVARECTRLAPAEAGLERDRMIELVRNVITATASNSSSMLQDIMRGRMTEIDHINGAFVREAERLGKDAPLNRTLTTLVKAISKG